MTKGGNGELEERESKRERLVYSARGREGERRGPNGFGIASS